MRRLQRHKSKRKSKSKSKGGYRKRRTKTKRSTKKRVKRGGGSCGPQYTTLNGISAKSEFGTSPLYNFPKQMAKVSDGIPCPTANPNTASHPKPMV